MGAGALDGRRIVAVVRAAWASCASPAPLQDLVNQTSDPYRAHACHTDLGAAVPNTIHCSPFIVQSTLHCSGHISCSCWGASGAWLLRPPHRHRVCCGALQCQYVARRRLKPTLGRLACSPAAGPGYAVRQCCGWRRLLHSAAGTAAHTQSPANDRFDGAWASWAHKQSGWTEGLRPVQHYMR